MKTAGSTFRMAVASVGLILLMPSQVSAKAMQSRAALGMLPFSGVSAEFDMNVAESPLRLGGLALFQEPYATNPLTPTYSGWTGTRIHRGRDDALDLILGINYSTEPGVAFIDEVKKQTNYGLLVAASYTLESPRFWLRFTPQYVFPLEGLAAYPGYLKSGLPWVEAGIRIQPWLSLSLGASYTPLRLVVEL